MTNINVIEQENNRFLMDNWQSSNEDDHQQAEKCNAKGAHKNDDV